jgi:hypothetical protein
MKYLRRVFGALGGDEGEVEARCLMALSPWIGNHFLVADREVRSRAEVLERAARLLEGQPGPRAPHLKGKLPPLIVVDPGSAVDCVYWSTPNPP